MKDEVNALVTHARLRNRLLMAQALQAELADAARRVVRLSRAGTPARLLTLQAVAEETGLRASAIVDAILQANQEPQ